MRFVGLVLCLASPVSQACSMFTVTNGEMVLFANNEDYVRPGVMWFVPGKAARLGRVNFGFDDDFTQGSMNEKGLCFDAAALPKVPWEADPAKKNTRNLLELIMDTCGTVEEALKLFDEYNCQHLADGQFMFADATGAAAVVTWDPGNHLSVVRREKPYLLITNDRLECSGLRDERFMLARRALEENMAPKVDKCFEVLETIHQEGEATTVYSNVFDLKQKKVYLCAASDFEHVRTFDLQEELAKGRKTHKLSDMFPEAPTVPAMRKRERRVFASAVVLPAATLAKYAGNYLVEGEKQVALAFAVDGDRGLTLTVEGNTVGLYPESETEFRFRNTFGTVSFQVDAEGKVTGLTMHRPSDAYAHRVEP